MAPVRCCGLHPCTALTKPCFTGLSEQLHGDGPGGSNAMIAVFPAQHLEPTLAAMSRLYLVHLIRVPWGPGVAHNNKIAHNLGTHGTALCLVPPLLLSKQCSRQCSSHKHTRPVCNPVCWLSRLYNLIVLIAAGQRAAPTPKESGQGGSTVFPLCYLAFSQFMPHRGVG